MVNKVQLLGHLGQDPELRRTKNGTPVTSLRLATNERRRDGAGKWTPHTEWHNVVVFGHLAESLCEYCQRGRQLFVEGRLRTRRWEDQNGASHVATEIIADTVHFLGPAEGGYAGFGGEDAQDDATPEAETFGEGGVRYRNLSRFRRAS